MWDLRSLTRDWSRVPCIGWWILNHWATREVPALFSFNLISLFVFDTADPCFLRGFFLLRVPELWHELSLRVCSSCSRPRVPSCIPAPGVSVFSEFGLQFSFPLLLLCKHSLWAMSTLSPCLSCDLPVSDDLQIFWFNLHSCRVLPACTSSPDHQYLLLFSR